MSDGPQTPVKSQIDPLPQAFGRLDVSVTDSPSTKTASVVVHDGRAAQLVGTALATWMNRRYSEAAALVKVKVVATGGLFALLAGGLTIKAVGTSISTAAMTFEFIMASPGLAEVLCGFGALVFGVSMDVYGIWRRSDDERFFWKLATDPSLDSKARDLLLERLRRP